MVTHTEKFKGYDRIKTIGKGAFGTAVLFKRLSDNKNVVVKEIILSDMSLSEKSLAFNEVKILASLNHPNIIRYMGSLEIEGSLLIEMEYADNGNLAQLINVRKESKRFFKEKDILEIMTQITAAISHMHSHKILHRDLKAANIFLNKTGSIKIGDFGISKIMTTRIQAQTVVGTPYYLSPEMCEGKEYDEKADIWAIGCILYELTCLHKPFEAPNLSSLIQKISTCQYEEIPEIYTNHLSLLIQSILQKDYVKRPSAQYIHDTVLPTILNKSKAETFQSSSSKRNPVERSILYSVNRFDDNIDLSVIDLPPKKIIHFSGSNTHFIAITIDNLVYTWGNDVFGQLGHGRTSRDYYKTSAVKNIVTTAFSSAAGEGFSVFLTKYGTVFTCGDAQQGCLGHNNWNNLLRPTLIDSLITVQVVKIVCGANHVLALTKTGVVYSWGSSSNGQLGLGNTKFCCNPFAVKALSEYCIKEVYAQSNSSACLDVNGKLFVSGDNTYFKLGILMEAHILSFQIVTMVKEKIQTVRMGENHTILVTKNGHTIGMGRNAEGQLGLGNCLTHKQPQLISCLKDITMIACGPTYTVTATSKNVIYVWGTPYYNSCESNSPITVPTYTNLNKNIIYKSNQKIDDIPFSNITKTEINRNLPELIKQPRCILALFASNENIQENLTISLEELHALPNELLLLVNTSAPRQANKNINLSSQDFENSNFSNNTIPSWMDLNLDNLSITTLPNTPHIG